MKGIERRLRALEEHRAPMVLPPLIVGLRRDFWPRSLAPGERVVVDYKDGGLISWSYRVTTDPLDHGVHIGMSGGYITECLQRRAAGLPSWPLPWEQEGGPEVVCAVPENLQAASRTDRQMHRILWRPPGWHGS